MHKLFKKFGSLALVACTVVALAALPVSAEEYWVTYIPDPPRTYEGTTFTPGLSIKGEDDIFEYVRTSGTIRTGDSRLSDETVYALSKCAVNYDNAEYSSDSKVFFEVIEYLDADSIFFLNRNAIYKYKNNVWTTEGNTAPVKIENTDDNKWLSASAHIMLSHGIFTKTGNIYRFPTALGTFNWTKSVTLNEILAS